MGDAVFARMTPGRATSFSVRTRSALRIAPMLAIATGYVVLAGGAATAAEAYLCDGGRVVFVELADLERMKRTDACIAGYYGLTGPDADAGARAAKGSANVAPSPAKSEPRRQPQPQTAAAPATSVSPSQFAARSVGPARVASERGSSDRNTSKRGVTPAAGVARLPVRTIAMTRAAAGAAPVVAVPVTPVAAPSTDYRNVRVINAGRDGEQWFHHGF